MVLHRFPKWLCEVICKLCKSWNTKIVANTLHGQEVSEPIVFKEARKSFYVEGDWFRVNTIPRATHARQCVAFNARASRVVNNNGGRNSNKHLRS